MGSWNATCNISQMPICHGDEIRVLFLTHCPYSLPPIGDKLRIQKNGGHFSREGTYSTDFWFPRTVPFKAKYYDSGDVYEIEEDQFAYQFILEQFKQDFVSQDENGYLFCDGKQVESMTFDDIWNMSTASGALRVNGNHGSTNNKIERLLGFSLFNRQKEKIMDEAKALPVVGVMIREDVWQAMINIENDEPRLRLPEEEFGDYEKVTYKDEVKESVLNHKIRIKYVYDKKVKELKEFEDSQLKPSVRYISSIMRSDLDRLFYKSSPPYALGIEWFFENLVKTYGLSELEEHKQKADRMITDLAEMTYVLSMFSYLRKTWHPGTGCGSQSNNMKECFLYYNAMAKVALNNNKKDIDESVEFATKYDEKMPIDPLKDYYSKYE